MHQLDVVQRHLARAHGEPDAFDLSTSTAISCPRESRLSLWKVSTCGSWSTLWLPGITCM
jgi:hypothetical protein